MREGFKSPAPLVHASSVAIVGASERARWPREIYENLRAFGYPGAIHLVNPRAREVFGQPCYPDLASLPTPPDHAMVIVPAPAVIGVLETGLATGLKTATIYAGNIGDGGDPESPARAAALKALVDRSGLVMVGPNCMGGNGLHQKFFGYPNPDLARQTAGSVAIASQSGGALQHLTILGGDRGLRFSYLMSSGNEIDLDLADFIDFFVDDTHTRVIVLFVEGVRRPQAFMAAAAKALAAGKPIIALKTGKSLKAREGAKTHTGAISGDYDVFRAMCERYGITVAQNLDDVIEIALAFQAGRFAKGPRVGWITTSGGTVDLLYDHLDEAPDVASPEFSEATSARLRKVVAAELAIKNPLDAGLPGSDAVTVEMCLAAADDPAIDMVALAANLPARAREASVLRGMLDQTQKPIIAFARMNHMVNASGLEYQANVGIPYLQGLPATIRAMAALGFYGARMGRTIAPLREPKGALHEFSGPAFAGELARCGLTPPKSAIADTPAKIAAAAREIGFPVALKIVSRDISHKTEVGGVRLNLRSENDVLREAEELAAAVRAADPRAHLDGFLVQEMARGVEVLLGARTDPLYGPMIMVGGGGVFVELMKDVAIRLLPITPADARAMLDELKTMALLKGYRGAPPADIEALVRAICGLADLYLDHRHLLADLEINPLIVLREGAGVRAVDVRPVLRGKETE